MKLYFLIFSTISLVGGKKDAKIIGGRFARKNEFPFAVALFGDLGTFCGGTLATLEKVITAGHCVVVESGPFGFVTTDKFSVVGGSVNRDVREQEPGKQIRRVRRVFLHPGYRLKRSGGSFNDISLCILSQPFVQSASLRPMNWVSKSASVFKQEWENVLNSGINCIGIGWGITKKGTQMPSPVLKAIFLKPRRPQYCQRFARRGEDRTEEGEICLSSLSDGTGVCSGDSGGPLLCGKYVIALLSSVINECGRKRYPANYLMYWPYMDYYQLSDLLMSFAVSIFHPNYFFLFPTYLLNQ